MTALGALWAGQLPLRAAFWTHAVLIGLAVNAAATVGSMTAIVMDLPGAVALVIHLSPLPYTVACVVGVWRSAARYDGPPLRAEAARAAVLFWSGLLILA